MNLIRTAAKERLPKGYSYPLGAEAISNALKGITVLHDASLWFSWRDEYWSSTWRQKIAALGELTLLTIDDSYLGRAREVRVYAVPSGFSIAARERLLSEFPRVRNALIAGDSSMQVSVTLSLAESANNAAAVNTPVAGRIRVEHPWRRVTEQRRSGRLR